MNIKLNFFFNLFKKNVVNITDTEVLEEIDDDLKLKTSINLLKTSDKNYLNNEKNIDYERNVFLKEIGFIKLKRVIDFMNTLYKVSNIENFIEIENKYKSLKLDILNDEMVNIIKDKYSFKKSESCDYDGYLPNTSIDILKNNYSKLNKPEYKYDLFKKYYDTDTKFTKCRDDYLLNSHIDILESYKKTDKYINISSWYYKIKNKRILVLYNKTSGIILYEIENSYYFILSEWNDSESQEKMNFKEFISNCK